VRNVEKKPLALPPPPRVNEIHLPPSDYTKEGCLYRVRIDWIEIGTQTLGYPSTGISSLRYHGYDDSYVAAPAYTYAYCWGPIFGLKVITEHGIYDGLSPSGIRPIYTGEAYIQQAVYIMSRKSAGDEGADYSIEHSYYLYNEGYGTPIEERYAAVKNKRKVDVHFLGASAGFIFDGAAEILIAPVMGDIQEIWCALAPLIDFLPPPLPPPKRCDCTMTCCPSTDQNDQLLRSLIKKVDKLSSIVGVDDYPVSLPTSLISRDEGFLGNLIPNANQDVPSLTRFLAWYVTRFDEIMGQWEIPIEIKDSNPTKPGDQPVGIKLPNMAEAIAEMFTLCFQTNINTETLLNAAIRNLAETGADKQQNFITYKLLQSLTDWVGYKQKDIKAKMPLLFTLNKTRYDQILQESEVEVAVPEFDEKFGLEADLMRFREAAAILQANYKVKVNPNGDIKAQILKYLVDTLKNVNKVNGEDAEQDFEDFLEEVETGFINTRGVTNNTEPYGKPFNQRPRIRDLTNFSTDTPES